MKTTRALFALAALLLVPACSGGSYSTGMSVGYGGYYDPYYDYYYRGGIYGHHVPPSGGYRPDKPRPPGGMGPGRPTTLPGRAPGRPR
jgi:hypothetical protein